MSVNFIVGIIGFFISFVLLFYFTAKYRESVADEGTFVVDAPSDSAEGEAAAKTAASVASTIKRASLGGPYGSLSLEIEDLNEKLRNMHYRLEEMRLVQENNSSELIKTISKLEQRLNTFEGEYVNKLQPTLLSLIEELEQIKPDKED
ncbi:TolA-binding protein [Elusimicrobium posterum]|uniref:hypothetical protein n=1 Tax=Elusimicrobium posterum TaxID=3116653 RepID=UPI003C77C30B